jgi:hypothetical protein
MPIDGAGRQIRPGVNDIFGTTLYTRIRCGKLAIGFAAGFAV